MKKWSDFCCEAGNPVPGYVCELLESPDFKRRRQILNRNGFKDVKDRITKQQYGPLIYKLKLLIFWNFSDLIGSCSEDNV